MYYELPHGLPEALEHNHPTHIKITGETLHLLNAYAHDMQPQRYERHKEEAIGHAITHLIEQMIAYRTRGNKANQAARRFPILLDTHDFHILQTTARKYKRTPIGLLDEICQEALTTWLEKHASNNPAPPPQFRPKRGRNTKRLIDTVREFWAQAKPQKPQKGGTPTQPKPEEQQNLLTNL